MNTGEIPMKKFRGIHQIDPNCNVERIPYGIIWLFGSTSELPPMHLSGLCCVLQTAIGSRARRLSKHPFPLLSKMQNQLAFRRLEQRLERRNAALRRFEQRFESRKAISSAVFDNHSPPPPRPASTFPMRIRKSGCRS